MDCDSNEDGKVCFGEGDWNCKGNNMLHWVDGHDHDHDHDRERTSPEQEREDDLEHG